MAAVRSNRIALKYVTRYLRNDRDIVMAAVISDGNALQYVSDDFRSQMFM